MTELGEVQVTVDGSPAADLEVVHAQFVLGLLETSFDRPTGEPHPQQRLDGHAARTRTTVGDEVLDFFSVQHVAGHDQATRGTGQTVGAFPVERRELDLPYHRSVLPLLDV